LDILLANRNRRTASAPPQLCRLRTLILLL
jgi:hypothetical protein